MALRFVYCPFPSRALARRLGEQLLARRLCACVNLLHSHSRYWWKGRQEAARETVLIAKTTDEKVPAVRRQLAEAHPYIVPCIAVLPARANAAFTRWVAAEVARAPKRKRR